MTFWSGFLRCAQRLKFSLLLAPNQEISNMSANISALTPAEVSRFVGVSAQGGCLCKNLPIG